MSTHQLHGGALSEGLLLISPKATQFSGAESPVRTGARPGVMILSLFLKGKHVLYKGLPSGASRTSGWKSGASK